MFIPKVGLNYKMLIKMSWEPTLMLMLTYLVDPQFHFVLPVKIYLFFFKCEIEKAN